MQSTRKSTRIAADGRTIPIRSKLPGTGDGHLNEHGGNRSQDHHQEGRQGAAAVPVPAAEKEGKSGQQCDGRTDGGRNRSGQDVPVLDVRQFVGNHPFEFFARQQTDNAVGHRHGRMGGVASRGKGIWLIPGDHIDLRHGQTRPLAQPVHHVDQFGGFCPGYLLGPIHAQHDGSTEPVASEIECNGHAEGQDHALVSTDGLPDEGKQYDQGCHEGSRPHSIHVGKGCVR